MIRVSFEVKNIPAAATDEEIEEWLRFSFGATGCLSLDNPLVDYEAEADSSSFDVEFGGHR
jgi:hypothetical protein